jgi:hypothetical protein
MLSHTGPRQYGGSCSVLRCMYMGESFDSDRSLGVCRGKVAIVRTVHRYVLTKSPSIGVWQETRAAGNKAVCDQHTSVLI